MIAFKILPKSIYGLASKGTFNVHGSLLPKYRGAAPIQWSIIHGEKDTLVSPKQSQRLSSWLNSASVSNEIMIVGGAPHFGEMFDADDIRKKVVDFLNSKVKQ